MITRSSRAPRAYRVVASAAIAVIVASAGLQAAVRPVSAAIVVDQFQTVEEGMLCIIRTEGARCHNGQAQRVTVGADGDLFAVDLLLSRGAQSTGSLTIEIRADQPNGTLLATSEPVPASVIPIGSYDVITNVDWVTFEFSDPPPVSAGDVIAIVLPPTPLDDSAWGWVTGGNAYLGGSSWESEPGGFWESGGDDLAFVTYLGVGPSPFVDTVDSSFFWDIEWLFESGITKGCAPYEFCPTSEVSRGQMAAFLDRALELPETTTDYFTDDGSSIFEANINRLAAAGITKGCTATRFCPEDPVRRDQMATFLARALDLPATTTDAFTDDEANSHEANINRLAAAGITKGCTATKFCPTTEVTRGQMAAFLRRALD